MIYIFSIFISIFIFFYPVTTKWLYAYTFLDSKLENACTAPDYYDSASRTCTSANTGDIAFNDLKSFSNNLSSEEHNYVREGTYLRDSGSGNKGSLFINISDCVVAAYPKDKHSVVIGTKTAGTNYNSDPSDKDYPYKGSSAFYPNPAISISGSVQNVTIDSIKTYGSVFIWGKDVTIKNCDLGGGGGFCYQDGCNPADAAGGKGPQGQVVRIMNNGILLKNNTIHHSCWGQADTNGAAVMGYNFSGSIENNTFYDNWGSDIRLKDTGNQQGKDIIVKNNYFEKSDITNNKTRAVQLINQDADISNIYIHNNIFHNKYKGIQYDGGAQNKTIIYNNTFINCEIDAAMWLNNMHQFYNNIYYHDKPDQYFYYGGNGNRPDLTQIKSNFNIFYSSANTRYKFLGRNRGTVLREWQNYSGKDMNSQWKDPNFHNPQGNSSEDFKRTTYNDNFIGSEYSNISGAYVTGNEIIGRYDTSNNSTNERLLAPENLDIVNDK